MRNQLFGVLFVMLLAASLAASTPQNAPPAAKDEPELTGVAQLNEEARALSPLVPSQVAQEFLAATAWLPSVAPRTIYRDAETATWLSATAIESLSDEKKLSLQAHTLDESGYYNTKYGTPLAYSRVLDLAATLGLKSLDGKRVLDFGYGTIGQLKLMATCGAETVGLDVDSFLTALYNEPADQGAVSVKRIPRGSVKLVSGRFSEATVREDVGSGYDLITSKNTLKRGYIHPPPEESVDKRLLVDLGLDDESFVRTIFDMLKPGGVFIIYNLSPKPAPAGEKYIPWADGRCPFEKSLLEKVGFRVVHFDVDDTDFASRMARALKWDDSMDVDNDLFGHYTILVKPES